MFKHLLATLLAFAAAVAFAGVDINKANQAELEAVKGLGTVSAGKIVDERKKGSFKNWNDVMQRVGGIKTAKASKLSAAGLTVNGESYTVAGTTNSKAGKAQTSAKEHAAGDKLASDKASEAKSSKK
jgi:competence protein ComEA